MRLWASAPICIWSAPRLAQASLRHEDGPELISTLSLLQTVLGWFALQPVEGGNSTYDTWNDIRNTTTFHLLALGANGTLQEQHMIQLYCVSRVNPMQSYNAPILRTRSGLSKLSTQVPSFSSRRLVLSSFTSSPTTTSLSDHVVGRFSIRWMIVSR